METHQGWIVTRDGEQLDCQFQHFDDEFLDSLPVVLDVTYSGINYKDALALQEKPGIVRRSPLVAGIDVTGTVVISSDPRWEPGDRLTLTGAGLGEELHGGLATRAHLPAEPLVRIPPMFSAPQVAAIGTAGVTAALGILALEDHGLTRGGGPVLVTGASGGVGSIAVAMLAKQGYQVAAATGRIETQSSRLHELGADDVLPQAEVAGNSKPLQSSRWQGVIDTVGSTTLAGALANVKLGGVVAACGLAGGFDLPTTVMPFILRGVSLIGIDSVRVSVGRRAAAWDLLSTYLEPAVLDSMTRIVPLDQAQHVAADLLKRRSQGRVVIET